VKISESIAVGGQVAEYSECVRIWPCHIKHEYQPRAYAQRVQGCVSAQCYTDGNHMRASISRFQWCLSVRCETYPFRHR
jgi:hypothetical protein